MFNEAKWSVVNVESSICSCLKIHIGKTVRRRDSRRSNKRCSVKRKNAGAEYLPAL